MITQEIPNLPEKIIEAVDNGKFAIFIGAGVSRLTGCWSWRELAQKYISLCIEKGIIDHRDRDTLETYQDNRKIITITYELLKEHYEAEYYDLMKKALVEGSDKKHSIYTDIKKLDPLIVTTNADNLLNSYYIPNRIESKRFKKTEVDKTILYKIHGTIDNKESLIFTLPSYFIKYRDADFTEFLTQLFTEYTVLFVGYGLAEFELLEFLFTKVNKGKSNIQHFILLDFFLGEDAKLKLEEYYYKHLGIEIIPYCKNKNGYDEQKLIFQKWASEINIKSSLISNSLDEIDQCFQHPNKNSINKVMQIILNSTQAADYFWKQLPSKDTKAKFLAPLSKKGFFNPENIPKPYEEQIGSGNYYIKQWPVLEYLKTIIISSRKKLQILGKIIDLINDIIYCRYKEFKSKKDEHRILDWQLSEIIFHFPIDRISKKHLEFIREVALITNKALVSSSLERFLLQKVVDSKNNKFFEVIIELVFTIQKPINNQEDTISLVDIYTLQSIAKTIPRNIKLKHSYYLIDFLISTIKKHNTSLPYRFSTFYINTIEENRQNFVVDKFEFPLICLLRDLLISLPKKELNSIIETQLLPAREKILKRILIHTINIRYSELKNILWNWNSNPLSLEEGKHELYELLKAHNGDFSLRESDKLLAWIESLKYPKDKDSTKEMHTTRIAYLKREWLTALDNDNFKRSNQVRLLNQKLKEFSESPISHPGYYSYSSITSGIEAPEIRNAIWNESNARIVEFILSSENKNEYNESGLINELKNIIKENPKVRSSTLTSFNSLPLNFKSEIFYVLRDLTDKTIEIDLNEAIEFASHAISENRFWGNITRDKSWFLSSFCWFAKEVLKNDTFIFNNALLVKYEKVIIDGLINFNSDFNDQNKDFIITVINSTKGKLYEAWLELNLRNGRLIPLETKNKWLKKSFKLLNEIITKEEKEVEFFYLSNGYLPNFLFLNKDWIYKNFDSIFPKENQNFWKYGFTSYLYLARLHKEIYDLFRDRKYLDYAITYYTEANHYTDRLLQHILIMYNSGYENIENEQSLISKILTNHRSTQYNYIISFYLYSSQRTDKILPLWKKMLEYATKFTTEEKQRFHENLSNWLKVAPKIDSQIVLWIKLSIDNIRNNVDFRLLRIITERADEALKEFGEIFSYLLEKNNSVELSMGSEKIGFIEKLYLNDLKEIADKACRLLMEKGDFSVKEIYKKYNP